MTRDQHLEFCRKCLNRKFDPAEGVVCSLTGAPAAFEHECSDFKHDENVHIVVDDQERLEHDEIKSKLSTQVFERLRLEQNLLGGIIAGVVTAVVCAVLWGVFTVALEFQISYMGILVGAAVGYAMRKVGKGVDLIFSFFGAGISLFGCILGNFFSGIGFVAIAADLGFLETLFVFDYDLTISLMTETFDIRDLIFYGVAIMAGYRLATRTVTEKDAKELMKTVG